MQALKYEFEKDFFMSDAELNKISEEKIVVYVEAELEPIVPNFIKNRYSDIEQISVALAQQDFAAIVRVAHNWKGIGAGYGFDYVSELGIAMGKAARAGQGDEVAHQLQLLTHYLEHIVIVYTE